jgi:hypothetical protein
MLVGLGKPHRVILSTELEENGLCLCPSDMDRNNFLKDSGGRILAVDFGAACFLPVSFFAFALSEVDDFGQAFVEQVPHADTVDGDERGLLRFGLLQQQ